MHKAHMSGHRQDKEQHRDRLKTEQSLTSREEVTMVFRKYGRRHKKSTSRLDHLATKERPIESTCTWQE